MLTVHLRTRRGNEFSARGSEAAVLAALRFTVSVAAVVVLALSVVGEQSCSGTKAPVRANTIVGLASHSDGAESSSEG
jgi:hypothetical protein